MRKKILIADDDPAIAESVVLLLNDFGYEADAIMDGQKIYNLEENCPDLLLLDVRMGREDGREICKHLKAKRETQKIPVIMFSASREIKKSVTEAGANDFIEKPFDIDELINKIEQHLN